MSILTSASSTSVSRGYDYYTNKKVSQIMQLNNNEYEAYVSGSNKSPYYVKINIAHPKKSYCDCPHANGNITCKHMVALYFSLFQDEVEDYEAWLNNDYEEEYEEDYYDKYNRGYQHEFDMPLFFDVVLDNFISTLTEVKAKELLKEYLLKNEEQTFKLYLEKNYNKYIQNNDENFKFLDKLNTKIKEMTNYYNPNYKDFTIEILNNREKKFIEKIYNASNLNEQIDKLLMNPELSVYNGYRWIALFYKKHKSQKQLEEFMERLEDYLDSLKHYSIRNSLPKSNILISLYLLKEHSLYDIAISLLKNTKYIEYIEYVIENHESPLEIYNIVINEIKENYLRYKRYLPDLLYRFLFIDDFEDKSILYNYELFTYLCTGDENYLDTLNRFFENEKQIIEDIEKYTKDVMVLSRLYKFYNKKDKLWKLLNKAENKNLLINNVLELKDNYNNELYKYFISEFYETLLIDKKREIYKKAARYVHAIYLLNNGENYVEQLITDLKNSEYQKCSALFEEIKIAIHK